MRTLRLSSAIVVALCVFAAALQAQQLKSNSIEDLTRQVRNLQRVDRDPTTPPEVKKLNRSFLSARLSELEALLHQRVDALRTYIVGVKETLTVEEFQKVEVAISDLEKQLAELKTNSSGNQEPTEDSASSASTDGDGSASSSVTSAPPSTAGVPRSQAATISFPPVTDCNTNTPYKDAPLLLTGVVERLANGVVQNEKLPVGDPNRVPDSLMLVNGQLFPMLFYSVADALTVTSDKPVPSINKLKAYQYLGETARTDKQVGAASSSTGTTSAIEKPGFASLLGFAVEKGAILKDINGDAMTLSTSPYVLFTLNNGGDTAENYARAGLLNRVGVSATFNVEDQNNVFASARRNQLTDWSVRARLYGDRSTRSKAFQTAWHDKIQPAIEKRLNVLTDVAHYMQNQPEFRTLKGQVQTRLDSALRILMASSNYTNADDAGKKAMLSNTILCHLKNVFDEIRSGGIPVGKAARAEILEHDVPALAAALDNLEVVRGVLKDELDALSKSPLATFAYINHRDPAASDYSEFKFLYEQDKTLFHMFNLVGNAGLTIYNKPNPLLNQTRIRDFSASLSFEGAVDSPFLKNQPDLSKVTYAFTGNYQRMRENAGVAGRKADLAAFQFKVDIPIYAGFGLPIAVTYSNGTEHTKKQDTRLNFGLKFDMDKLFALSKLLGKP